MNWHRYGTELRHCQPMYWELRPLLGGVHLVDLFRELVDGFLVFLAVRRQLDVVLRLSFVQLPLQLRYFRLAPLRYLRLCTHTHRPPTAPHTHLLPVTTVGPTNAVWIMIRPTDHFRHPGGTINLSSICASVWLGYHNFWTKWTFGLDISNARLSLRYLGHIRRSICHRSGVYSRHLFSSSPNDCQTACSEAFFRPGQWITNTSRKVSFNGQQTQEIIRH